MADVGLRTPGIADRLEFKDTQGMDREGQGGERRTAKSVARLTTRRPHFAVGQDGETVSRPSAFVLSSRVWGLGKPPQRRVR